MDVRTYRARSMQEALQLVRRELGPEASVLQTPQPRGGLRRPRGSAVWIEVTASATVSVPSRLAPKNQAGNVSPLTPSPSPARGEGSVRTEPKPRPSDEGATRPAQPTTAAELIEETRARFRDDLR